MIRLTDPSAAFLDAMKLMLGPAGWRTPEDSSAYFEEPRHLWTGRAAIVLRPADAAQAAQILQRCSAARIGVVPYAGGTGLVGGQTLTEGPLPVLVSVDRMTAIREIDPENDAITVEAGAILATVQAAAEAADRLFPLSLASEGSCRIGGNLAANAGGVRALRYGVARDLCLGIEAALPDGSILHGLKSLRKNNFGYDLRHLLIGSEGTLGLITAAALKLFPRPRETATAFCAVPSPAAAVELLHRMREQLGETISAFELMCAQGMAFLTEHVPDARNPLAAPSPWHVLVEAGGGAGANTRALMETALMAAMDGGLITDAALAESEAQRGAFWRIREANPEANRKIGAVSSHDISTPLSRIAAFIARADAAVAALDPALRVNCFGHVGDGNLHYNVFAPAGRACADYAHLRDAVKTAVHDLTHSMGGSVSAEHGVGRLKTGDLIKYGDPAKLTAMRAIKAALDPAGIMNPGAVLSAVEERE